MSALDEDADLQRRFGGLERLYGVLGAALIREAHVAVVGVGGVGSWAAEALARSGVGEITLIDLDHVAESNINRQVHALTDTVGMAKVQAMRNRIGLIHPRCTHLIAAFNGYVRHEERGEFTSRPKDPNHPHEDLMDALRGGIRDAMPEGRKPQPAFGRVPARQVF